MKKIKKLLKKINNNGSSLVMVIVALAFIGIIVGALLTAVGYSYRLKLQDLNSRDNFYYVEQAMNEIYAGVGSEVVGDMQNAYAYTVENMVEYDLVTKSYVVKPDAEVQDMFAREFMSSVQNNPVLSSVTIADTLESYITNDSVKLDKSKIYIDTKTENGKITKIIIKNVTLTRTQNYSKNVASGSYTQTISTDIEIGEPDFNVLFNSTTDDYANIFKYSMVADMGIEVVQPSTTLNISGNIYAASDYYNKDYNKSRYKNAETVVKDEDRKFISGITYEISTGKTTAGGTTTGDTTTGDTTTGDTTTEEATGEVVTTSPNRESADKYIHGSVTSKEIKLVESTVSNDFYNRYSTSTKPVVAGSNDYFDGVHERSMYSGLFIEGSDVSIMADMVIIPGTVAVMDEGSLSLYGKNGETTSNAELWADNIVLGGSSEKKTVKDVPVYSGSSLVLRTDTYVKDDTEINAYGANFTLKGSYFGYGDSTEKDSRKFIPTVNKNNFQITYGTGENATSENRGHYNSSAIIVNGQQSTLDFSKANILFLAGRSYIELSKDVTVDEVATGTDAKQTYVTESYTFVPETNNFVTITDPDDKEYIRDYKTGESVSLKTNQLAYIPVMLSGMPEAVYENGTFAGYFNAKLRVGLQGTSLFEKYFPETVFDEYMIPCVMQEVSGKKYYYYDFETAYDKIVSSNKFATFTTTYPSAQDYAAAFIVDYVAYVKSLDEDDQEAEFLTDISNLEELEFDVEELKLPKPSTIANNPVYVYSSGAITVKENIVVNNVVTGYNFDMNDYRDWDQSSLARLLFTTDSQGYNDIDVLSATDSNGNTISNYNTPTSLSDSLELEYNLVKWNLGHYTLDTNDQNKNLRNSKEIEYIKLLLQNSNYGEASITPINKFLNMNVITDNVNITPNGLKLSSEYSVWVSYDNVTIDTDDSEGKVKGVIVTKGDVEFTDNVKSFEGLIVSGGKIFITKNLTNMYSSPAICQAVLRECQLLGTTEAKTVLNLFKGYEVTSTTPGVNTPVASPTDPSNGAKTIDSIDYSDVCRFSNWMKNVE